MALRLVSLAGAEPLPGFADGAGRLNDKWGAFSFSNVATKTQYAIEKDSAKGFVLHAVSEKGASALRLTLDRAAEPNTKLTWAWKIGVIPEGSSAKQKATDDYSARLYVLFAYDPALASTFDRVQAGLARALYGEYPPHAALNYIVEPNLPVGTVVQSPYTAKVRCIVIDNGKSLNTWQSFSRNVYEDYIKAFGSPPPTRMMAVVVMTDADNTQTRAEAWYAELDLK